ncbi:MAG: biopolymer transporter ExbD [bacterium]
MAFRRLSLGNRKIQMISLIDLIFILLIFFIITSILIKLTKGEARLYIPTPKNEPGEAQVLVQILDDQKYLWVDHTAIDTLNYYTYKRRNALSTEAKVDVLLQKMTLDSAALQQRIYKLVADAREQPNKDYFVLIRCPDYLPYHHATKIVEKLVDAPNFEYGCVAGTIEEIKNSRNIHVAGNVIQIDL